MRNDSVLDRGSVTWFRVILVIHVIHVTWFKLWFATTKCSEIWTAEKGALVSHTRKLQASVHVRSHRWFTGSSCQMKQDPGPDDLSQQRRARRSSVYLKRLLVCLTVLCCVASNLFCAASSFGVHLSFSHGRVERSRVTLSHDTRKQGYTLFRTWGTIVCHSLTIRGTAEE